MTDANTIKELLLTAVIVAPFITGIVEVIKRTTKVNVRWTPAVALVVGGLSGVAIIQLSIAGLVAGLIMGLMSVGLWETAKIRSSKKE